MSDSVGAAAMQEFFIALISFLLIEPVQSAMAERFGDVSPAMAASVTTCLRDAAPVLVQQSWDDPWQAATHVLGIWSGVTPPEDILAGTTASCAETVEALRGSGVAAES
jgi:hypothetical protein